MKQIILDNELSPFWVTENGLVWREDTNHWYAPYENCGYLSYNLKWKNKTYPKRLHRLIAEYYIPNPENKPYVHHKDGNRLNNTIENLQWVTVQENNEMKVIKKETIEPKKPIITEKEEWRQYLTTEFWVSNYGRVKNVRTGNILKGNVRENGYVRVGLRYDGKIHGFNLHNLVWLVWRGKQKGVIDHINGDKQDNRLSNLQDISQSENLLKSDRKRIQVANSLEKDGEIIKIFNSQSAAAKYYNINAGSVNKALYNGWRAGGFYWRIVKDEDYV